MKLLDDRLNAFYEIARRNSFTKASEFLHLTQSALSHRIKKLELDLQVALFIREPSGLILTDAGSKLLQYCRNQTQIEDEFLRTLTSSDSTKLVGALRFGSVSSLSWSVLIPSLSNLLRMNPDIHIDVISREVSELPQLFRRGRFEFLITIEKLNDVTLEEHNLGVERYVLIESSIKNARKCTYLDHDEGDKYTTDFFALQGWEDRKFSRSYLDDNHGILSGVQQGLGKAVVPIHLLRTQSGIKVVKGLTPLEKPIYFYYFKQNFYSRLHQEVVKALIAETKKFLE